MKEKDIDIIRYACDDEYARTIDSVGFAKEKELIELAKNIAKAAELFICPKGQIIENKWHGCQHCALCILRKAVQEFNLKLNEE